jgi:hypothetical protein
MNRKLNFALALAAGILGGVLSHYLAPIVVLAQSQNAPPKEIRAQRFILVDAKGIPRGVFAIETSGMPTIEAMTDDGHIYMLTRQVSPHHPKPTLLPIQP